jgi:N-acetylmuramic acid 6-phosphate etherase
MSLHLGIEGGGTRSTAILAEEGRRLVRRAEFGPANSRLCSDSELRARFEQIAAWGEAVDAVGLGLAGVRTEQDRARVTRIAQQVWPGAAISVTHDLEIALLAHECEPASTRVLVLSGTGSCCFALSGSGRPEKLGGWGHLLGDVASGYAIGLAAARRAIFDLDRHHRWGTLGQGILRATLQNEPNDLIGWIQAAPKSDVAALAIRAFEAAAKGDRAAREILSGAAEELARDALLCASRLARKSEPVNFVLAGSVLLKQPKFARHVAKLIRHAWPRARVEPLEREGAWGAVKLSLNAPVGRGAAAHANGSQPEFYHPEFVPGASPTEQRNPRSMQFDRLSVKAAVDLMIDEEAGVADALRRERRAISKAVQLASAALKKGGRIFYAGAGTSGRLGVLDASECPPTFRAAPEMVQGIMAGGQRAIWSAVEGAEDNAGAGAESVKFRGVGPKDVLVGIAASGRTPFVWGALAAAREAGASTVLLHFNPGLKISGKHRPGVVIAPNLGPEVLTGSTRLKCGTATKLVLNMISTIAMTRLGKVASNLMIDLNPSNVKLRDRAVRIVRDLTGADHRAAAEALERNAWSVKKAWQDLSPPARRSGKGK